MLVSKDVKFAKFLVVSFCVLTPKHKVKDGNITWKQLFVCFVKQLKEPLLDYIRV